MKPFLSWLGAALCIGLAVLGIVLVTMSTNTKLRASDARASAARLYRARLAVAEAQKELGGSNLEEAVTSAREANDTARRVLGLSEQIVSLLEPTQATTADIIAAARRGAQGAATTREQAGIAADVLGEISSYQRVATRYADQTNGALRRILRALRRTNEEFEDGPL